MPDAIFRFYEELNDYLPLTMRKTEWTHTFETPMSIRDMITSMGIPPEDVDLILANGSSVDFSYTVKDKDRFSIYPVFETFDISGVTMLRDKPLMQLNNDKNKGDHHGNRQCE